MLQHVLIPFIVAMVATLAGGHAIAQSPPEGQLVIAFDTSIAATYFDPAEAPGLQTPFVFHYALHDALVKPLPGNDMAPCLAESWSESPDGLRYEFKLRQGVTFHNGDPFTAADVQFSFQRYKGISAKELHDKVKAVEVIDPHRVRFVLHAPWPDFLTFYATMATGAAWVVPKKYLEQVGDDGFKRQPVGLGPYRFVRQEPGIELVLEANEHYWRQTPTIKRIIFKGVPERSTRLAMLLLAEAGYPHGFEAGDLTPFPPFFTMGEAVGNYLGAVGIRTKMRTMERAAFLAAWREKKLHGLILTPSGALGNAATRLEPYVISTGAYAYGGYPDIDGLFQQQAVERERGKRQALLHQIQRLMHERVMHAPIYEPATVHGVGPRVAEPAVGLNPLLYFTAPYEELRLRKP